MSEATSCTSRQYHSFPIQRNYLETIKRKQLPKLTGSDKMILVHWKLKSWQRTCDTSLILSAIIYLLSPLPISCCSLLVSLPLSKLPAVLWKLFINTKTKKDYCTSQFFGALRHIRVSLVSHVKKMFQTAAHTKNKEAKKNQEMLIHVGIIPFSVSPHSEEELGHCNKKNFAIWSPEQCSNTSFVWFGLISGRFYVDNKSKVILTD